MNQTIEQFLEPHWSASSETVIELLALRDDAISQHMALAHESVWNKDVSARNVWAWVIDAVWKLRAEQTGDPEAIDENLTPDLVSAYAADCVAFALRFIDELAEILNRASSTPSSTQSN